MKIKIYLISMLNLAFTIILFSQDSEPTPLRFNFIANGDSIKNQFLSREYFPQKKFSLGVQWGGHSRMMKALKMNVHQAWQPRLGWNDTTVISVADPVDSMKYIWDGREYRDCRGFQFKPTLYIPENKRGEFIVQTADTTKSVFGFSYIRDTNQLFNNPPRTRFHLYKDSINYIDSVVLGKVWVDDKYERIEKDADTNTNGKRWTFSINLRRLNANELGSINDTILTIKLPYRLKVNDTTFTYDTIKFSSKPMNSLNDTVRLKYREDRGFALNETATNENFFVITNKMLPNNAFISNTGRQDITINAVFVCENPLLNNPTLKSSNNSTGINNIDIQIKYHGKRDIGINYCRISTPFGYDYLVGKFDSLIQDRFQSHINVIQNGGYEIFGFYGRDEFDEQYFLEQRYRSKLLNYTTISEGAGGQHFDHYRHNVEPMNLWIGSGHFREFIHTPYFRTTASTDPIIQKYRLFHSEGYIGHRSQDTLHSSYETDMDGGEWWKIFRTSSSPLTMNVYFDRILNETATQLRIDGVMYNQYYRISNYLYENKLWWANNFPVGNWDVSNNYARLGNARPHTGEEVRWLLWSSLLMGSKGLMYDARCDAMFYDNESKRTENSTIGFMYNKSQLNKYNTLPLDSLIFTNDPAIGCDFIPEIDSASYIHNFVNRDSTSKYLGVPKERIYYGRKSPRIEMYKTHSWIRINDSLLMSLRLVSAFSKGYRIWLHADTARFASTIMSNFIKLDDRMIIFADKDSVKTLVSDFGVKTRPIGREFNSEPFYETYDSSFFDIALHRFKDDQNLSSGSFVLAVQNRRTDPLIYFTEDSTDKHLLFITPSEFDSLCLNGGVNPLRPNGARYPASVWQSYKYKQLGAREITIPFNYKNANNDKFCMLRVTELAGMDSTIGTWQFRHNVDTVIAQDASLSVNFSPGEGKLFRIEIIEPDTVSGFLAHSNQTKMVAHNELDASGNETDYFRYHLVYHKPDPTRSNLSTIFYVRSFPISPTVENKQIRWEQPVKVSDGLFHYFKPFPLINITVSNLNCYYPSITVRKVENSLKAFIVYQAKMPAWGICDIPCDNIQCSGLKNPIIETQLNVGLVFSKPDTSKVIVPFVNGDNQDIFINPVISSASNGNYYTWADSIFGI